MRAINNFAFVAAAIFSVSVSAKEVPYEVWAADQSNSEAGLESRGVEGSFIWIWDSEDIESQLDGGSSAEPMGCGRHGRRTSDSHAGPCDVRDVFPSTLREYDVSGFGKKGKLKQDTGNTLSDIGPFGRLHGMIPDPQNQYMNVNMFAPGGGFVGIMDGETKEAIALFRVTATTGSAIARSLHMSFWNDDGSALLLANLNGKILERIDIERDRKGNIIDAIFNQSASVSMTGLTVTDGAKVYRGRNEHNNEMIGRVAGAYREPALSALTPNGYCKENGCNEGLGNGGMGGRGNNVIVCPIVSTSGNSYVTFGGGGLIVVDSNATPMAIVGEYGMEMINGAGCGGVQTANNIWLNAGASASDAGATQSTFSMYTLDDTGFPNAPESNSENVPAATLVYKDDTNTATIGNTSGEASNDTGQTPGVTTRRDAHGAIGTLDDRYVHNADRIQNIVEVFDSESGARTTYDLTSANGDGSGGMGACEAASVNDDAALPGNDPTPDLMDRTPDGKYLVVALRGPTPVSVTHAAQGSCPGVGIIELLDGGASGRLVTVLRSTNTIDTAPSSAPGGHIYTGAERSDPHGASVRARVELIKNDKH